MGMLYYNIPTVNEQVTNMSLQHKKFTMAKFVNAEALFRAKAEYYMREAEKLQMELTVAEEKAAHLERKLFEVAEQNDRLEARLSRHEAG